MYQGEAKIQLSCEGQLAPLLLKLRHLKMGTMKMSS